LLAVILDPVATAPGTDTSRNIGKARRWL